MAKAQRCEDIPGQSCRGVEHRPGKVFPIESVGEDPKATTLVQPSTRQCGW